MISDKRPGLVGVNEFINMTLWRGRSYGAADVALRGQANGLKSLWLEV
jgi:hypothetical protein